MCVKGQPALYLLSLEVSHPYHNYSQWQFETTPVSNNQMVEHHVYLPHPPPPHPFFLNSPYEPFYKGVPDFKVTFLEKEMFCPRRGILYWYWALPVVVCGCCMCMYELHVWCVCIDVSVFFYDLHVCALHVNRAVLWSHFSFRRNDQWSCFWACCKEGCRLQDLSNIWSESNWCCPLSSCLVAKQDWLCL